MATYSLFSSTPANTELNDGAVTVGVIWATNQAGNVTGIRFYAPSGFDGVYTVGLWNADTNTLLASKAATGVSTGWNTVALDTPVSVSTGITYLAGFFSSGGSYGFTSPGSWPYTNGPLYTASSNGARYAYGGSIAQPTNTSGANYFADLVLDVPAGGALTGTSAATSNATGTLTGKGALTGTAAATSNAAGTLTGKGALTGSSAATSNATGTLSSATSLTGTSSAASNATGTLTGKGRMTGGSTAASGATGSLTGKGSLSGASAATSNTTGALGSFAQALSGISNAISNAIGTLTTKATLTGLSAAMSGAMGTMRARRGGKIVHQTAWTQFKPFNDGRWDK